MAVLDTWRRRGVLKKKAEKWISDQIITNRDDPGYMKEGLGCFTRSGFTRA